MALAWSSAVIGRMGGDGIRSSGGVVARFLTIATGAAAGATAAATTAIGGAVVLG